MLRKIKKSSKKIVILTCILSFLTVPVCLYCFRQSRAIVFERYDLPVKNLPEAWEGKKLIQISDIHASWMVDREYIGNVFKHVNKENPDIIVLTGDYLISDYKYLESLKEELEKLKTNKGTTGKLAILGNHDCNDLNRPLPDDKEAEITDGQLRIMSTLESAGFTVLLNEHTEQGDKEKLVIVGLGDVWAKQTEPEKAFQDLDCTKEPIIVLIHNPDFFPQLAELGDFTVLTGHTHGGQILFPGKHEIFRKKSKYLYGFYREKGSLMYVNRGMGCGIVPMRLNCPPEVTVFTLVPADNQ